MGDMPTWGWIVIGVLTVVAIPAVAISAIAFSVLRNYIKLGYWKNLNGRNSIQN